MESLNQTKNLVNKRIEIDLENEISLSESGVDAKNARVTRVINANLQDNGAEYKENNKNDFSLQNANELIKNDDAMLMYGFNEKLDAIDNAIEYSNLDDFTKVANKSDIISQISEKIEFVNNLDEQKIVVKLKPDILGELEIELKKVKNGYSLRFNVSENEVREIPSKQRR